METYTWKQISKPSSLADLKQPDLAALADLWREQRERLRRTGADQRFLDRLIRRWSIETGIIERLYHLSEGATQLLVQQGFDAALIAHGDTNLAADELVRVLEDHRDAIDFAMDIVGGRRQLSVGWIKELHALLTRHQATTRAMLPDGRMADVKLRCGEFKRHPNNPSGRDGNTHEYCPPEHVTSEMERLISIYGDLPEIPEVRSAWLHHAFTQIHPFQDGNGRVARVLASIDFIKAGLFPLLVLRTEKSDYMHALRTADDGDLQPLVIFFSEAQKRMLMRGFSEAEQATANVGNWDTVIHAARTKLQSRRDAMAANRLEMIQRLNNLATVAQKTLSLRATDLQTQIPEIKAIAVRSDANNNRWYRNQLVQIAQQNEYWADLHAARRWARMELRNGGRTELVIAFHFVGHAGSPAAVAVAFVTHREDGEALGDNPPLDIAAEPLLLGPNEGEALQRRRFTNWLEQAAVQGVAIWSKFL
jgi:Fic family protein